MYICLCNPFSDKTLQSILDKKSGQKTSVSEVYDTCSNGEKPNCCSCMQAIKDVVKAHNRKSPSREATS